MADIPLEFLRKLRRVEIQTNRLVEDLYAGRYKSIFRGRGMDFEEVREYQAGDEIRHIDWNVSARMNDLFVKVFREERELTVLLAVDISGSVETGGGTRSKRELMAEVAAVLAFSAIANNDRVGLLLFTDGVEDFTGPNKGRSHVLRLLREILYYEPEGRGTNIEEALRYVANVVHRSSMVFLISDFLDADFERSLRITNERYDLIPVVIADQRELELPDVGWIALEDAETGEIVELNTSDARVREEFAASARGRLDALRQECVRSGIDTIEVQSGRPYLESFQRFFENRLRRR